MELERDEKTEQINERLSLTSKVKGLTFGTDAYLLSAYVRRKAKGTAVDLGAGTGVISMLCASRGSFAHIRCVEIQKEFCDLITRNAAENGLSDKMDVICRDVRELTVSDIGGEADAVFSNPPYMRAGSGFANDAKEKDIARREVFGGISDFCEAAARILRFGGLFTVVFRPDRVSELLCAMTAAGLEPKRMTMVYATTSHVPCLVLCEAKKGASPGLFMTKPLILTESGRNTADTDYIYENGAFHEQYQKP